MKKIEYFCCLLGLVLTGLACQDDDETTVIPKPEGITYGTVTDKGGNVYKTLTIGNQTWLAENFRYRPDEATAADLVTYGESYGGTERAILEGTNMNSYQTFCRNYSGRKFLLYLREQLLAADEAGRLNTSSPYGVDWIVTQVGNYTIPNLLSYNMHDDIKDELMAIWNDAVNYYFKVDQDYLTRFGYLYSYGGAAVYALSTAYNSRYVYKNEGAYFWSSDQIVISDSLSNGIVRNISLYHSGIRRMTSRLISTTENVRPSYSVRLVK